MTGPVGHEVSSSDGNSETPGSNPGHTPVELEKASGKIQRPIYLSMCVACNGQQYGVVNTYMLVTCLKNDIDGNIACYQYGTQSKSLCSVLHAPN